MTNPKDAAELPLSLVAEYGKKYPLVWDAVQKFREWPEAPWDLSKCYIPIASGCAICEFLQMPPDSIYMVPALAAWRQSKEVYTFDHDLAEALYAQADDVKIPCQILMQLPFYCIYIDSGKYRFFCHLENDDRDNHWELRFVRIRQDGSITASYLHLGDYTVGESIMAGVDESAYQKERIQNDETASKFMEYAETHPQQTDYEDVLNQTVLSEMLQLALYICTDNADVQQQEENKRTYRKTDKGPIKDKYREIRKWETGYYVGAVLRRNPSFSDNQEKRPHQGGTKRPHMRRGHWHHFWKGKEGNRELVLHWVLPIFVRGDATDGESPARITPVK